MLYPSAVAFGGAFAARRRYTPRVLRFHLGPFQVSVEPWFWITAVFLSGMTGNLKDNLVPLLIWVAVVFVSVLVHELGHALVGRALGGRPEIILHSFGGLTAPNLRKRPSVLQEIALDIAGPLFGLSLWLVAWALMKGLSPPHGSPMELAARMLSYTSLAWAVLNLLPVLELDGGHVMQAALRGIRGKDSRKLALGISAVVAAAVALYAWRIREDTFLALFFAYFSFTNGMKCRAYGAPVAEVQEAPTGPSTVELSDVARITEVARRSMAAGDPRGAISAAELLETSDGAFRQAAGLRIRAGVSLAQGGLHEAGLQAGRSFALWPNPDAAVVAARANLRAGDRETARSWLRRAVEAGALPEAIAKDAELAAVVA